MLSDAGQDYDNISQSSFSVRSAANVPLRSTVKWTTNGYVGSSVNPNLSANGFPKRSFSVDNNAMTSAFERLIDARSRSPQKKSSNYPDPPPSFILNISPAEVSTTVAPPNKTLLNRPPSPDKNKIIEYDSEGRIHYVTRPQTQQVPPFGRSTSFDRSRDEDADRESQRKSSTENSSTDCSEGTNILYQVRREELARGGQPSVKLMAKAFDSIDMKQEPSDSKKGFFGIRKSRSVETTQAPNGRASSTPKTFNPLKHNQSMSQIDDASHNPYGTLPRGGRNPFKNMGSKLVERVRRSLSRSSRGPDGRRESDEIGRGSEDGDAGPVQALKPPKKDIGKPASPKKTKKKAAENKAKKVSLEQVMNGTQ